MSDLATRITAAEEVQKPEKVTLAGLVTANVRGVSRTGNPNFSATIEDFTGSYEFKFWGKDCEAVMAKLAEKQEVFLEGEIKPRFFKKDLKPGEKQEYGFKLTGASLLGNVAQAHLKSIVFNITTDMLNDSFRKSLVKLFKENKGTTPVKMMMYDKQTKYNIVFHTQKYMVRVTQELLFALRDLGINYTIEQQ